MTQALYAHMNNKTIKIFKKQVIKNCKKCTNIVKNITNSDFIKLFFHIFEDCNHLTHVSYGNIEYMNIPCKNYIKLTSRLM
jgi:hypothetical protein